MGSDNSSTSYTPLCELGYKYGTDKCPQLKHHYTPFYYQTFNGIKNKVKKVLELGVGHYRGMETNPTTYDPGLNRTYHRGASLYMWRDFFPNAQIYGMDNRPETVFEDSRLQTMLVDERDSEQLKNLIKKIGSDIDIVIDDASHKVDDQIFAAKTLLPLLKDDVIYAIEDVGFTRKIMAALNEIGEFEYEIPAIPRKWKAGMIIVIRKKQHGAG